MLAEFYSMADYSTTARRIHTRFAGGCWARRQLRNGIRDVLVASELRISQTSLKRVLGSMLAEFYSMADYSTTVSGFRFCLLEVIGPDASYATV